MFFVFGGALLWWGALGELMAWGVLAGGGSHVLDGRSSVLGPAVFPYGPGTALAQRPHGPGSLPIGSRRGRAPRWPGSQGDPVLPPWIHAGTGCRTGPAATGTWFSPYGRTEV